MPVYEYKCKSCGEKFEMRRGIQDLETGAKCPRCGSSNTQKVYSIFDRFSSGGSCAPRPRTFG